MSRGIIEPRTSPNLFGSAEAEFSPQPRNAGSHPFLHQVGAHRKDGEPDEEIARAHLKVGQHWPVSDQCWNKKLTKFFKNCPKSNFLKMMFSKYPEIVR